MSDLACLLRAVACTERTPELASAGDLLCEAVKTGLAYE